MDRIEQLRFRLISAGVDPATADDIVETALVRIKNKMVNSLEAGFSLAKDEADKMKASGFNLDVRISSSHRGLEIDSSKGNFDYSSPPFPMLNRLLAKGKTAKDGSVYRVIPVGGGSSKTVASVDASQGVEGAREVEPKRSLTDMARQMANAFNTGTRVSSTTTSSTKTTPPAFRTASSKQDPSRQWVIPAREADMTPAISNINSMMAGDLDKAVDEVLQDMDWEIRDAIYNA